MAATTAHDPQAIDREPLSAEQPRVTEADACAVALSFYGLNVTAELLAGERDRNFMLRAPRGERWVLKFYNASDDAILRDFQQAALRHIERHGGGPVPALVPTQDREIEFRTNVDGVQQHGILISFLEGMPLDHAPSSKALHRAIGRASAELDAALTTFEHPAARRPLLWDIMRIDGLKPMTALIPDDRRRRWIEDFISYFVADVRPRLEACRWQVIHNDLNSSNLLISWTDPSAVSGIIDFGDMVHAPLINEIGVAASYAARAADDLFEVIGAMVRGFEEVTRLAEHEVASLYDTVVARLVVRVLIYEWRSSLFPGNRAYILRNSISAWSMIEARMKVSPEEGRSRVLDCWLTGEAA